MARKETANVLLKKALTELRESYEPSIIKGKFFGNCDLCGSCFAHVPYCLIKRIEVYFSKQNRRLRNVSSK